MAVKSVKRLLRDAVVTDMQSQMATELSGIQVVSGMAGNELLSTHIRVTTPTAEPQVQGVVNLGRWDIEVHISAVSQIDDTTEDAHDNLIGLIEGYVLQGNRTLAARLSDVSLTVANVYPSASEEVTVEGMRYSKASIMCECFMI